MTNEKTPKAFPCNECQAGMMRLQFITYFTWLGEELVTVPGFPAWVCDLCGRREYDQRAISWLTTMLNPETGRARVSRPRLHRKLEKQEPARPSTDFNPPKD
jgi:YgiT-type zinc finger domain-containing protein